MAHQPTWGVAIIREAVQKRFGTALAPFSRPGRGIGTGAGLQALHGPDFPHTDF
jgi:hypothetical protein